MEIKDEYKVGACTYKVIEKDFVEIDGNKNYYGLCNYKTNHIEISKDLGAQRKEQTFVHELTHAIFNEAGYMEHDEEMIERLSIVLYQVIKDNFI